MKFLNLFKDSDDGNLEHVHEHVDKLNENIEKLSELIERYMEDTDRATIGKLNKNIERLDDIMDKYNKMIDDKKRLMWLNLQVGIIRGIGTAIGATVLFALVWQGLIYTIDLNLPLISDWISTVINTVEANRNGIQK